MTLSFTLTCRFIPAHKENPEYLVTEDLLELLAYNDRSNPESACA